jgi:CO/xanthine dehydrogenase Mo-binding subunit
MEGEPVGLVVAADSKQVCDEALRLVKIDWEVFPFVMDEEEAVTRSDIKIPVRGYW